MVQLTETVNDCIARYDQKIEELGLRSHDFFVIGSFVCVISHDAEVAFAVGERLCSSEGGNQGHERQ